MTVTIWDYWKELMYGRIFHRGKLMDELAHGLKERFADEPAYSGSRDGSATWSGGELHGDA